MNKLMSRPLPLALFLSALVQGFSWSASAQTTQVQPQSQAGATTLLISIADPAAEPVASLPNAKRSGGLFRDARLNEIVSQYPNTTFERAYPNANDKYLRSIWRVTTSSPRLAESLQSYNLKAFPYYRTEQEAQPLYTPNDFGYTTQAYQGELNLINAKQAWDTTRGDTSITVGITDTYFNTTHPDLVGKFKQVRYNTTNVVSPEHGTMVAGIIGANTDNGIGLSSIGFNTRMDVKTSLGGDADMLDMSRTNRVLNGSWNNNCFYDPGQQAIYNEVYENGAVAVFAAGNGASTCGSVTNYVYPASLDHNISVTSVGWNFPIGTYNWTFQGQPAGYNWKDVHDKVIGFPGESYTHNDKVDISAPGFAVSSLYHNPNNTASQYILNNGWGTSFAAPFVSGTVALMFAANKNLSPYQAEVLLKRSAVNIDTIAQNVQYAGMLGSGRLNAGAAVAMAKSFDPNDSATATMFIPGIELTHRCVPGATSNNSNPVLKPVIINGTAPFTYKWEDIPGNGAYLDDYSVANPQITFMDPYAANLVWLRLTVYDSSPTPKVASKVIQVTLTSSNTPDLAIRDSYADVYESVNLQDSLDRRDWDMWKSPDIWNRQANDNGTAHQTASITGATNYMNVRVHNAGCKVSGTSQTQTDKLRVFWSMPSAGHNWATDWLSSFSFNTNNKGSVNAGGEITGTPITIPSLQPGQDTIIRIPWTPKNPKLFVTKVAEGNWAYLARISTYSGTTDQGPGITESAQAYKNIRNSNNIAVRNLIQTNLTAPPTGILKTEIMFLSNPFNTQEQIDLRIQTLKDRYKYLSGDHKSLFSVRIYLGDAYDRWVQAGRQGTYSAYNDALKFVTFNDLSEASLKQFQMTANEHVMLIVEFRMQPANYFNLQNMPKSFHEFALSEHKSATGERIGSVNFQVYFNSGSNFTTLFKEQEAPAQKEVGSITAAESRLSVYPNPATNGSVQFVFTGPAIEDARVVVQDLMGKTVKSMNFDRLEARQPRSIDINNLPAGIYTINVTGRDGISLKPVKLVVSNP